MAEHNQQPEEPSKNSQHTRIDRLSKSGLALQKIIEVSADGIIVIDEQAKVRFANPAALKLFGKTEDEFLDSEFAFPLGSDDLEISIVQNNDGRINLVHAEMRIVAFDWEGRPAHLVSLRDVSLRVKQHRDLDHTVALLKNSNEDLNQFAVTASHDLREPLRTIRNFSKLLAEKYADQLDDDARRWFSFMETSAADMQQLINRLLDYARTGSQEIEWKIVDLNEVASNVVQQLNKRINETNTTIEIKTLPMAAGSPGMLQQLLQNLFTNAIHHCKRESPHIIVSGRQQVGRVRISVIDNGDGIEPDERRLIFHLFARGKGKKKRAGSGIGLATCSRIVQLHGGEIWVEPTDTGCEFVFTVPDEIPHGK